MNSNKTLILSFYYGYRDQAKGCEYANKLISILKNSSKSSLAKSFEIVKHFNIPNLNNLMPIYRELESLSEAALKEVPERNNSMLYYRQLNAKCLIHMQKGDFSNFVELLKIQDQFIDNSNFERSSYLANKLYINNSWLTLSEELVDKDKAIKMSQELISMIDLIGTEEEFKLYYKKYISFYLANNTVIFYYFL